MCILLAVLFTFQVIFSTLCVTLFPSSALSRGFRNERRSNVTKSSVNPNRLHPLQSYKHGIMNKRPSVHIKERGAIKLTKRPTNSKRIRLFGRVGRFLHCNANGTISGWLNQFSKFGEYLNSIMVT